VYECHLVGLPLALITGVSNERFNPANITRRGDDLRQTLPGNRAMNPLKQPSL
jgi:hypothetical protein